MSKPPPVTSSHIRVYTAAHGLCLFHDSTVENHIADVTIPCSRPHSPLELGLPIRVSIAPPLSGAERPAGSVLARGRRDLPAILLRHTPLTQRLGLVGWGCERCLDTQLLDTGRILTNVPGEKPVDKGSSLLFFAVLLVSCEKVQYRTVI